MGKLGLTDDTPDDDLEIEVDFVDGDDTPETSADPTPPAHQPAQRTAQAPSQGGTSDEQSSPQADDATTLRAQLDQERVARQQAERERDDTALQAMARAAAAEARGAQAQRESARGMVEALDVKIKAAREALKIAKREGNTDLEFEAEEALEKLRGLKTQLERDVLPSIPDPEQVMARARQEAQGRQRPQGTAVSEHTVARNTLAQQWASANPWMSDAQMGQAVQFLSAQIHREGIDPNSPDHFRELTQRLSAAFPKLGVKGIGGQPGNMQRGAGAPPVAGARTSASRSTSPNRVRLTAQDAATMRKFKLDPKDKKAQLHYARAIKEIEREESGRAGQGNR